MEDSVVEHDALNVPGYSLIQSDVTGRAVFKKGEDQLEVFTVNRQELEHCFGVDLIYINLTKQNVVMLQYKMLEPSSKTDDQTDWVYRPDGQLDVEIARMNAFAAAHVPHGFLKRRKMVLRRTSWASLFAQRLRYSGRWPLSPAPLVV